MKLSINNEASKRRQTQAKMLRIKSSQKLKVDPEREGQAAEKNTWIHLRK
jgi:hypothetical protein